MARTETVRREPADFESDGTRCAAWLYRPSESASAGIGKPPVVVMGHGFGLTQEMRLPSIAERFAERGLAVLTFDYRSLGDSDGRPRNVVDPFAQLDDWKAAVSHVRAMDDIDGDQLGVWGFSFGGGEALITAAREDADAYVGQTPVYDGIRTVRYVVGQQGPEYGLRMTSAALKDLARKYTRRDPYYIPIIGDADAGEVVALPSPGSKEGHEAMLPEDWGSEERAKWNICAARVIFQTGRYRPIKEAPNVDCPAFVVEATEDQLAPKSAIDATVAKLHDVNWVTYDTDHFGAFFGDLFEEVVEREGSFLEYHLLDAAQR
jgi:pimeloyl-ACP methyl ester carboxylesterase